jgi:hypothetical protein
MVIHPELGRELARQRQQHLLRVARAGPAPGRWFRPRRPRVLEPAASLWSRLRQRGHLVVAEQRPEHEELDPACRA